MRGHLLYDMNHSFGPRFGFGPFHGRRGPFGPHNFTFASPCGFESFGGFQKFGPGPHHGPPRPCRGDRSPDRECGHDRQGDRAHFGLFIGRGHHRGGHHCRGSSPPSGPHGRCCLPRPHENHYHGPLGHGPRGRGHRGHGPHGSGPRGQGHHGHGHGPHAHEPFGPHGFDHQRQCCQENEPWNCECPPPEYDACVRPECKNECNCNKEKQPAQGSGETSRLRRRHMRCGCRGSPYRTEDTNEQGSADRCGRRRRRCCRRNGSCDRTEYDQNPTGDCVTRDDAPADTEERDRNQGPGILVQNIVVDNTPRPGSV